MQAKRKELAEAEALGESASRQRIVLRMLTAYSEQFRGLMDVSVCVWDPWEPWEQLSFPAVVFRHLTSQGTHDGLSNTALHGGASCIAPS